MRRTVAVLFWTLAGLVACERALSLHDQSSRRSSSRLRRLVPPALLEGKSVAAMRVVDTARRETLLYARTSGGWRCLSRAGVPADEARLAGFINRVLEAQGILQKADTGRRDRFGLDAPHLLRVSLHGPRAFQEHGQDLIALAEIGAAMPGGRGTYARPGMSLDVIAVDDDLRGDLAWPKEPGLAPLVDPRIVPGAWSGSASVERIEVHPEGGAPFELRKRPRAVKREEMLGGRVPWDWQLATGASERPTSPGLVDAYARFLQSATFELALDPRGADGLGLARPRARIVLRPVEGPPVEIQVGGRLPAGRIAVRNGLTKSVFAVDAEVSALLVPRAAALLSRARANPWEAWPGENQGQP